MKFKKYLICLLFLLSHGLQASNLRNYEFSSKDFKYAFSTSRTPSISAFIASSNGKCAYDQQFNQFFFRGSISQGNYETLLKYLPKESEYKKLDNLYRTSRYQKSGGNGNGLEVILAYILSNPTLTEGFSLLGIIGELHKKPVASIAGRDAQGKAYTFLETNKQYIWQPMALVNATFLAINLTNPWICLAGNGLALFTFSQNSPLPDFEKNAFSCSIFDKALYDSSLMSEELSAEFKLAGYYNDSDQLNEKFFQDYKDKKLLISEKFKPYEAGIYEAFDTYLKEKNTKKSLTPNINPAAQRQPLSAILPQST